jgi:hypothetical protein
MLRLSLRGKLTVFGASSPAARCCIRAALSALLVLVGSAGAHARTLQVAADRIEQGPVEARGLLLSLRAPAQPGAGLGLSLQLESLNAESLGYVFQSLDWNCELRPRDVDVWHCSGPLRTAQGSAGELSLDWARGDTELTLVRGRARLQADIPSGPGAISVQAERLPAAWLQPALQTLWSAATLTDGQFGADLELDLALDAPRIEGRVRADGMGLDTRDGLIATADLNLQGRIGVELGALTRIGTELSISGGELLYGSFYASLPAQPMRLELSALGEGDRWQVERLNWNDPEALQLEATARFALDQEDPLIDLRLDARSSRADVLLPRYLDSMLGTLGLPGSRAQGGLRLRLEQSAGSLRSLHLEPETLGFSDGGSRFAVDGLQGEFRWTADPQPQSGQLSFAFARMYTVELGGIAMDLRSSAGALSLSAPVRIPLLGGALALDSLSWRPETVAAGSDNLALSARLEGLDLQQLSAALGWPPFSGELSGEIPGVVYRNRVLSIGGALLMRAFGGEVEVSGLNVERPFGVAPTLGADVVLRGLDLQPLTAAFDFGEITGRMNGYIRDLRLLDWTPVAFDARFETDEKASDQRRISQRAVRDLSSVGGMGAAAALQQSLLRAFENFSYARIGIACRLRNDVCQMDGIERSGRGYTIVEGSGLPRITVNGLQREVDWPVLMGRLKAVTEGQSPTIE